MDCIALAQGKDRWLTPVNEVMNLRDLKMRKISWLAEDMLATQEGLYCMELV